MHTRRAAYAFAVATLLWSGVYLARTPWFGGPWVARAITAQARAAKVDLEIQTFRPTGLLGLTFEGVRLRVPRGAWAMEVTADELSVWPRLSSLWAGAPRPGEVELRGAAIRFVPHVSDTASHPTPASAPGPAPPRASSTVTSETDMTVRVIDATVEIADLAVSSKRAFRVGRIEAELAGKHVRSLQGYGALPDGVTVSLTTPPSTHHPVFQLTFDRESHLSTWWHESLPLDISIGGLDACPKCEDVMRVRDLRLGHPAWPEVGVVAANATLKRKGEHVELLVQEMELENASERGFGARITQTSLAYHLGDRTFDLRSRLVDPAGQWLDVEASWRDLLTLKLEAERFDATSLATFADIQKFQPGVVHGRVEATVDVDQLWVDAEVDASLENSVVHIGRLHQGPLTTPRLGLNMHVLADRRGRALTVSRGELMLGDVRPISFDASLIDAGKGWRFAGRIAGQALDPQAFRDAMPAEIRRVAQGATYRGSFGFELGVDGHTAFPDELVVEGELTGDVEVVREGAMDVQTLETNGPPPQLLKADLAHWRSYSDLPPMVPKVLLAAEDAAFFGHPGFDWAGLRAAVVHNIEAGSFERGGSTISQQVAKNLFLSPERTIARKLEEAYLTWRMESRVSKERILEIYLNLADWGGVTGIERAALRYFGVSANALQVPEMALLAAILPNPTRFGAKVRQGKLDRHRAEKVQRILNNLRFMQVITPQDFSTWNAEVTKGQIGRLRLVIE